MPPSQKPPIRADWLIFGSLVALALAARFVCLHQETGDMQIFEDWSHQLVVAGGWRGLSKPIGNYNAPFMYFLLLATYLPGTLIVKIKLVWMAFDLVLAWFTYKLVGLAWPGRRLPVIAALLMLFVPTVVLNASFYGQVDAMWACFAVGGVYFLIIGKHWWGVSLCAVAFSLKPQGIFIFPLIALLVLAGRTPWRSLLAIPAVYFILDLPALLVGRSPGELFSVYSLDREGGWVANLTYSGPSVYAFIPASSDRIGAIKNLGDIFTVALVLGVCYIMTTRNAELTKERIVTAAALFAIMVPFFLPGMHERYFFLADVMTVILAFFRPRLWFVPIIVQCGSLLSYESFLFGGPQPLMLPLVIPATMMLVAMFIVGYSLLHDVIAAPPEAVVPQPREVEDPPTEVLEWSPQTAPATSGFARFQR